MVEILERLGNVLFWCCVPTTVIFALISIKPGLNHDEDFGDRASEINQASSPLVHRK